MAKVLKRFGQLRIVDVGVKSAKHRSDVGIVRKVGERERFQRAVRWILINELRIRC